MGHFGKGRHHLHRRKRIHLGHESYPHPDRLKRFVDKAVYGAGIFGPIMTLPQVTKIWVEKNAAGVSVISWAAYILTTTVWLIYGLVHKEKPIIVTNCIWLLLEVAIVVGGLIYG